MNGVQWIMTRHISWKQYQTDTDALDKVWKKETLNYLEKKTMQYCGHMKRHDILLNITME